ncbi:type I restriction enzyme HsdR N-terminal domain-containing protein [Ochrobactrum cytisi]|nr:type I restriction enzyme HsdR N-terminal domain-containing protein [Brucella cytisi]
MLSFIEPAEAAGLRLKMSSDKSQLGKVFTAKSSKFHSRNVEHDLVEGFLCEGWEEYGEPLKTKTRLRKQKAYDDQFKDDVWCQLYRLGYRALNVDPDFCLPFGSAPSEKKRIDIVAMNEDSVLLVDCQASETSAKPPSLRMNSSH